MVQVGSSEPKQAAVGSNPPVTVSVLMNSGTDGIECRSLRPLYRQHAAISHFPQATASRRDVYMSGVIPKELLDRRLRKSVRSPEAPGRFSRKHAPPAAVGSDPKVSVSILRDRLNRI